MQKALTCIALSLLFLAHSQPGSAAPINITGPAGSGAFGGDVKVLPNGNIVVVDAGYSTGGASDVGAVYLYSPTGTRLSMLTGSTEDDRVGSDEITVLANGNYVVVSTNWHNGAAARAGAVTWCSKDGDNNNVPRVVSAANSLVGSHTNDAAGDLINNHGGVIPLPNGNYLVSSIFWTNGSAANAGAVTWGNGETGVSGVISETNSLVGSHANDNVGERGIVVLSNNNYVVSSDEWDNGTFANAGAVTWGSGESGVSGVVSEDNSLVGTDYNDNVGAYSPYDNGVFEVGEGNYVVASPHWTNGLHLPGGYKIAVGAVTWADGTTGIKGTISASNSLIGGTGVDEIGSGGVTVLSNGNYVIRSPLFNNGSVLEGGAVTWGNGSTGTTGVVTAANSLVGAVSGDLNGAAIIPLTNGNYVVSAPYWDAGALMNAGAAMWCDGAQPVAGLISANNALIGSHEDDRVGLECVALANGHYVVGSAYWDRDGIEDAGAATWGNGTSGVKGAVSALNSLVGNRADDEVGYLLTALTNGNYVVASPYWNNGATTNVGAVTWGDGSQAFVAEVSTANSLIGGHANDGVGEVTALPNGNYLVYTFGWDNGSVVDAGAVTWGNGTTGIKGVVSASNSLVNDAVLNGIGNSTSITVLSNGNYLVYTGTYNQTSNSRIGALTWGSGTSGISGVISPSNSLVGMNASALVDAFDNGSFAVRSTQSIIVQDQDGVGYTSSGSVTWGSGTGPLTGYVTEANSLVDTGNLFPLDVHGFSDGAFAFSATTGSILIPNPSATNSVTLGVPGSHGKMSAANTVYGTEKRYAYVYPFDYDATAHQLAVGRWSDNIVTLIKATLPPPTVAPASGNVPADAETVTITGTGFSPVPGNNQVIFPGNWQGVVISATSTQLVVGHLPPLTAGPITVTVIIGGSTIATNVQVGIAVPVVTLGTAAYSSLTGSLVIHGSGFSTTPSKNVITFNGGVKGIVTAATLTELTIGNLTGLDQLASGALTAIITTNGRSSGVAVQIGLIMPVVTASTAQLGAGDTSWILYGTGFSTVPGNNSVLLNNGVTCTVIAATATQLTLGNLSGLTEGALTAIVTIGSFTSGDAVQIGTVIPSSSGTISLSAARYQVSQSATSVTITLERGGSTAATGVTLQFQTGINFAVPPLIGAVPGTDYRPLPGPAARIDFAEGQATRTVTITLLPATGAVPNKYFIINLLAPVAGTSLGTIQSAAVYILANDTTKPTLTLTAPIAGAVSGTLPFLVKGVAGDVHGLDRVEVSLNGGAAMPATLAPVTSSTSVPYSLSISPNPGTNTILVKAYDLMGNSTTIARAFVFTRRYALTVARAIPDATPSLLPDKVGTVTMSALPAAGASALSPTTANAVSRVSLAAVGTTIKLTANALKGYVFGYWLGLPDGVAPVGNVVSLTMPQANTAITAVFLVNPFTDATGGSSAYFGLIHPSSGAASSNANEGFLSGTLTRTTGAFSGKLLIDGVAQPIVATFFGEGTGVFTVGASKMLSLAVRDWSLTLAYTATVDGGRITATLTKGLETSTGTLAPGYYSATRKVPPALLDPVAKTSGFYTFALDAKAQTPDRDLSSYPQGSGFGSLTLSNLGVVTYAGTLADGTAVTGSTALFTEDESPLFAQLVTPGAAATVKGGSLGGVLTFGSEVAADLLWIRPAVTVATKPPAAVAATQLYTSGWANGIHIDLAGALYAKTMTFQAALALAPLDLVSGNAQLSFSGGQITGSIDLTHFNIAANAVTNIPKTDTSYKLTLVPTTGVFSGTFTPNWTNPAATKPAFKGILIQKGSRRGGHGYFLSNRLYDTHPQSGVVVLGQPR